MASVKSAFTIAVGERGVLIAINLLSYVIIARLVGPEDVGVFSVASAFVAMLAIFRDFGTGYYIATTRELTQEKLNTAFTFSWLIGFLVFLIIELISHPVGVFFEDERVTGLLRLLAFNSVVLPVTGCLMTAMRRQFLYGRVFWVNLAGSLAGTLTTISLGYLGYGAYALAIGVTTNYIVSAFGAFLAKPIDIRLGIGLADWRSVFSFGGKNSLIGVVQQTSNSLIEVVIGKYLGFVEAGLISRALGVVNLFNRDFSEAIRSVAIHSFAKSVREDGDIEGNHRVYFINYTSFGFFYFSFVFFFAEESIYLLSGSNWLEAVPYLKFFAGMGAMLLLVQFLPLKAMAQGGMDRVLKAALLLEPLKFLVGFLSILHFGTALAYSASAVISGALMVAIYWHFLGRVSGRIPFWFYSDALKNLLPGVFAVGLARVLVCWGEQHFQLKSLLISGVAGGVIALTVYVLILVIIRHSLYEVIRNKSGI